MQQSDRDPASRPAEPAAGGAGYADGTVAWAVAALVAATVLLGALWPVRAPVPADYPLDMSCLEWTDGCVVCKRVNVDVVACSLAGIACTTRAPECLHRSER